MNATQKSTKSTTPIFSDEEKAAMQAAAKERKAAARRSPRDEKAEGLNDLLAKIADMPKADRVMAERIHAIVKANAPGLSPRTWYGMPAYSTGDEVLCFFKPASKFKARYATLGFSDAANLDEGNMWPTEFALKELTPADEARIAALVKKAAS